MKNDGAELVNLATKPSMKETRANSEERPNKWLTITEDPFRCSPHGVLQDKGEFKDHPSSTMYDFGNLISRLPLNLCI